MFSRMFPMDASRIYQEVYDGALSALWSLPIATAIGAAYHYLGNALIDWYGMNDNIEIAESFLKKQAPVIIAQLEEQKKQTKTMHDFGKYKIACFVAPLIEEFVFRGAITPILQASLRSINLDPSYAPILSNILFTLTHPTARITVFYLGKQLENLVGTHNGSLWSSITAHSIHNFVTVLFNKTPEEQIKELDKQINHIKFMQHYQHYRAASKKEIADSLKQAQSDADQCAMGATRKMV